MDAVHKAGIGHLGLPLGAAEIGAVLYGHALNGCASEPRWLNRDRFVLSAGHGSMFLYGWLHLAGYDVPMAEIVRFRQLHSTTPGHPEFGETPGVEATTGPLGQGVANAVGMAISGKIAAATFNTPVHTIFDHHVVCLAGDGCMQEGVALEAVAFAGHHGLDNLILIYDANDVTLDAQAEETQSDDTEKRFRALGWHVQTVDGHDLEAFLAAFEVAKETDGGQPHLIIARTEIGRGIPEVAGTWKAHGEGGAKFIASARAGLGLPADEHFFVSPEVRSYFAGHQACQRAGYDNWLATYQAWGTANPELAAQLDQAVSAEVPGDLSARIPAFAADAKMATRAAGGIVLNAIAPHLPMMVSGSADLYGSTRNYLDGAPDFKRGSHRGARNFRFGIREHAMGAMMNGMAYDGLLRPSGATFLVFADYLRPAIRLAALAKLPVFYIFTHDSVGVGEDGPTHQPVETVSSLRLIPGLDVIRPADPEETAGAYVAALQRTDGPTALILTRQNVPNLSTLPVETRRQGAALGGYVAQRETGTLRLILLASGSEVELALGAAKVLGEGVRVVSLPCFERFVRQSAAYQEEVLPAAVRARVAVEAGVSHLWHRFVGPEGAIVAIDRFGLSAPGGTALKELGMSVDNVVNHARRVLG